MQFGNSIDNSMLFNVLFNIHNNITIVFIFEYGSKELVLHSIILTTMLQTVRNITDIVLEIACVNMSQDRNICIILLIEYMYNFIDKI